MDTFVQLSAGRLSVLNAQILYNQKQWEWGFLRKKCRNLELEQFYEAYMQRLRVTYLSLFIFIQSLVVGVHSLLLLATALQISNVYIDVCIYIFSMLIVWLILSINFREWLTKRYTWITYVTSWLSVTILVLSDVSVPIYHAVTSQDVLRPTLSSYVLYAIYIFMPLPDNIHAFLLGMAATASYLISYAFVTYRKHTENIDTIDVSKLVSEAIFLMFINFLGLYFRMMMEIAIRTTLLDRRLCIEENLLLRYARDQEKNLLLSIIPAQIANKIEQDVKARIEQMRELQKIKTAQSAGMRVNRSARPQIVKRWRQPETETLFIEPHNDVTVLYADVVNYTYLTTTLDVKTLVATIHDLFVKFDMASAENNVLRIKFLGDCYYCAAGVPIPNPMHAKCCVDLGLRMIKDIRDVRIKRKLNIDMRIGVHSGNILSGVIGSCKWQYDIWSKDVDIANRLEATGLAGRVHVSEQTLKLLDGEYLYEEGTPQARCDPVLRKYGIHTFLIKPPKPKNEVRPSLFGTQRQPERVFANSALHKGEPNTNFMQSTIIHYNQIRNQAKLEMSRELDKMPIGRIELTKLCFGRSKRLTQDEMEEQTFRSNITSMCLFFKDWRWERLYMKEPDIMLKYSIFFGFITFLAIATTQIINQRQSSTFLYISVTYTVLLLVLLVVTWYKKLWIMYIGETDASIPKRSCSIYLYSLSDRIQSSIVMRVGIYLLMIVMYLTCTMLQLSDCNRKDVEDEDINSQLLHNGDPGNLCFNPWGITESLILTICMSFLFSRIPFVLKLSVGTVIICAYAIIVVFEYDFIYERSPSTNVGFYPEYSHLLILGLTLGIFHLMDRQTEFISKVDFNWKRQLLKKQDDAKITNDTISILINNILPSHVVDIYMRKRMRNELYYEEYETVAVMFATICNYDTEKVGLRVLNEIICDFDEVLNSYTGIFKIEKIKVAGWTYMAACGLDVTRSEHSEVNFRSSSLLPNGRRSHYSDLQKSSNEDITDADVPTTSGAAAAGSRHGSITNDADTFSQYEGHSIAGLTTGKNARRPLSAVNPNNVVYVLAQFALDLMRALNSFNQENLQFENGEADHGMLRIGISHGEVMAGVVGSYKPHYDIWGNAVNMASRMDSTGVPGSIQVTAETATALSMYNIKCTYRGLTAVKGRGEIPTYFVDLDGTLKDVNFVKINSATETEEP